jgi:hypothetical protein
MTATLQSIRTYFAEDHDRLDGLFASFRERKRFNYAEARLFFREFKFGLQRHIVWEEQILFPLFEQKTGMVHNGPTEVMRQEHRLIGPAWRHCTTRFGARTRRAMRKSRPCWRRWRSTTRRKSRSSTPRWTGC